MKPESYVNIGFLLSYSFHDEDREDKIIEKRRIYANQLCNLTFVCDMKYDERQDGEKGFKRVESNYIARVNRNAAEIDLHELCNITKCMEL